MIRCQDELKISPTWQGDFLVTDTTKTADENVFREFFYFYSPLILIKCDLFVDSLWTSRELLHLFCRGHSDTRKEFHWFSIPLHSSPFCLEKYIFHRSSRVRSSVWAQRLLWKMCPSRIMKKKNMCDYAFHSTLLAVSLLSPARVWVITERFMHFRTN